MADGLQQLPRAVMGGVQVQTADIAASAITAAKIASDAVTAAKIATDAVTTAKIEADAITTAKIATDAVTTAKIAADAITTAKMEDSLPQYATATLTNAQMLALRATPITIIAAPGAGKVLEFISATLFFDYTAAYTETADNLAFKYENGSGSQVSNTIEATGFLDATADTQISVLQNTGALITAKSGAENKAVVLHNTGDGELGGGNAANVVRVNVCYRIVATGW